MRANGGPGIGAAERGVNERAHVADLVPAVVALAFELDGPDRSAVPRELGDAVGEPDLPAPPRLLLLEDVEDLGLEDVPVHRRQVAGGDRKSTRLNSSHGYISYAVFC